MGERPYWESRAARYPPSQPLQISVMSPGANGLETSERGNDFSTGFRFSKMDVLSGRPSASLITIGSSVPLWERAGIESPLRGLCRSTRSIGVLELPVVSVPPNAILFKPGELYSLHRMKPRGGVVLRE